MRCAEFDDDSCRSLATRAAISAFVEMESNDGNIYDTPLRRTVAFPRQCLLDRQFEEEVTRSTLSTGLQFRPTRNPCSTKISHRNLDRFIPSRVATNFGAANYLLTKTPPERQEDKVGCLDVLSQSQAISTSWKKEQVKRTFEEAGIIEGLKRKTVLTVSHPTNAIGKAHVYGRKKEWWGVVSLDSGVWKVKPRRKPLLTAESIVDMPGLPSIDCQRHIDWSSNNTIAANLNNTICVFGSISSMTTSNMRQIHSNNPVTYVKWSNSGKLLAIATSAAESVVSVFSEETLKVIRKVKCKCSDYQLQCAIQCICWSNNDDYLITGCENKIMSIFKMSSDERSYSCFEQGLVNISVSPNNHYIAVVDESVTVRIVNWETLTLTLEITHWRPIQALAWHPWETGILCIGGGVRDGSLSLWNVNTKTPLCFRTIEFKGHVRHLLWNKLSGELVVHWFYHKNRRSRAIVTVLGCMDRIVDVLPVQEHKEVSDIMWNHNHAQIAIQVDECFLIWNFFGTEASRWVKSAKKYSNKDVSRLDLRHEIIR